mmetsp:Transcript_8130/g.13093  ORF Transcript_8130/g.13093 Transcript_8130/m.13093 type:complete len:479 (-) Transcript_8130:26-1462(-)
MSDSEKVNLVQARKENLQRQVELESYHSVDYDLGVSEKEAQAQAMFKEILKGDTDIDTGKDFLLGREDVEKSRVYKILQKMPKGALLHTHGISTGPFEKLVEILRNDQRVYIYENEDNGELIHGEIRYLGSEQVATMPGWVPISSWSAEKVLENIQVPADTPREKRWDVFQNVWMRIRELSDSLPLWDGEGSYFWHMLTTLLETGVTYVEIKQLIPDGWVLPSECGKEVNRTVDTDEFMRIFLKTVDAFKAKNPRFVGAKMVWCSLKFLEPAKIKKDADLCWDLQQRFPDTIAGYDLVGHEDTLHPISNYFNALSEYIAKGGNLLLHAGETIDPDASQLYDAIALGSKRIGHAYALPKFPALMRIVRDKGITVECCPISNQVLGYVQDLRNHPGYIMLNNGIKLTISSDDAGLFKYTDLTADFAMVTKAWGLGLSQLRHLARQSFICSALKYEDIHAAVKQFEQDWEVFLDLVLANKI